ncbi:hypothetical protein RJ639_005423 [Escallonia herrerae]|uniref:Reverse transcriptase Ty1/copia-type domain-containing protein n=1 Tax=Escallonia herrerae TaxID=1293975 RepID=A0AA88VX05_9ASTE|nr:hypothetical protein RJ639_005423 [Escallonia herrerae]
MPSRRLGPHSPSGGSRPVAVGVGRGHRRNIIIDAIGDGDLLSCTCKKEESPCQDHEHAKLHPIGSNLSSLSSILGAKIRSFKELAANCQAHGELGKLGYSSDTEYFEKYDFDESNDFNFMEDEDADWFATCRSFDGDKVLTENDVIYTVVGIGSIQIRMYDGILRTLTNLKHVPELRKYLISLVHLALMVVTMGLFPSAVIDCWTPEEDLSGTYANYKNLRIYDCPAYAHKKALVDAEKEHDVRENVELEVRAPDSLPIISTDEEDGSHSIEENEEPQEQQYSIARNRSRREIQPPHKYGYEDMVTYALRLAEGIEVYKKNEGTPGIEDARYRARVVAKGFTQREGIDYNEIFFHVVKHSLIRVLLAMIALYDLELEQLDVTTDTDLVYHLGSDDANGRVIGYVDSDDVGNLNRMRSLTSYVFTFSSCVIN